MPSKLIEKTMRVNRLPHIWCPGCGHGILMRDVAQAIENCGLDPDKVVIVSGIGCSSRAAGYMNYNTLHTTHGRAIAFATGVKLANPELTVIAITSDGDASAFGGNHLITRFEPWRKHHDYLYQQCHLRYDRRAVFPYNTARRKGNNRSLWKYRLQFRYSETCRGSRRNIHGKMHGISCSTGNQTD